MLHEGTLFCYLTAEDSVTVDVLNLHGYTVTPMVDKFRGKRFVLQLSHEVRLLIIVTRVMTYTRAFVEMGH